MAGRALVVERAVAAECEARRGEVERADDGAGRGGEVAGVGLAELLPGHGAERLVEHPVVPALRVHLGPLRQSRHRRVRHVRRRPDYAKIVQASVSNRKALVRGKEQTRDPLEELTVVPDVAGGAGGLACAVLQQLAVPPQRLHHRCDVANHTNTSTQPLGFGRHVKGDAEDERI